MRMAYKKKCRSIIGITIFGLACLCGCSGPAVTTGEAAAGEVTEAVMKDSDCAVTVGERQVSIEEARAYLYLLQAPYEAFYGNQLWESERAEGTTWGEWLITEAYDQICEIEVLCQSAQKAGMALSTEEKTAADEAALAAFGKIRGSVIDQYDLTQTVLETVYERSKLAGNYYDQAVADEGVTLTTDEIAACQAITVQQIFIASNDTGHLKDGQTQAELAASLLKRAKNGEDFLTLAGAYSSETAQTTLVFNQEGYELYTKAWLDETFCQKAWALNAGDMSEVFQTDYGYHILKCTAKNTDELKQLAQDTALNVKQKNTFSKKYETLSTDIVCSRAQAWEKLDILEGIYN